MKELEYPFDANLIMKKKIKLKKQLLENKTNRIEKKIAILGGYTTHDIKLVIELFLLNYGIAPQFYESEYNKYYEEALFPSQEFIDFNPDLIYICTSNKNILNIPIISDSSSEIDKKIDEEMNRYYNIWNSLKKKFNCPIIQNNVEMPAYRLLGNLDASDCHGLTNYFSRINTRIYEYAKNNEGMYICDINYISADYGLSKWSDMFCYYMYKYALNVNAIPFLAFNVANIIKSIFGKNKKGFVLDLDNTLWGGVIGDDGVENIVLGPETPEGQAYIDFQKYLKKHIDLGLVLNVNSKNDEKNALAGLKHPNSVLCVDDFLVIKANWKTKDVNFNEIASEINIAPESLVFIDDNPAERDIVSCQIKGVSSPNIGTVKDYIQIIDRSGFFEVTALSNDDLKRNEMYKKNIARKKEQSLYSNYGEYLESLEMIAEINAFTPLYYARIAQLTNKSNQFNLTTKRYTQFDIEKFSRQRNYITLSGKLIDKYGDNGVVSIIIGKINGKDCHIDTWLMSCRVLKRDMEYAMMDQLVKECRKLGVQQIVGYYIPTEKNGMVRNFYKDMGFELITVDDNGSSSWVYKIDKKYENKNKYIFITEE